MDNQANRSFKRFRHLHWIWLQKANDSSEQPTWKNCSKIHLKTIFVIWFKKIRSQAMGIGKIVRTFGSLHVSKLVWKDMPLKVYINWFSEHSKTSYQLFPVKVALQVKKWSYDDKFAANRWSISDFQSCRNEENSFS